MPAQLFAVLPFHGRSGGPEYALVRGHMSPTTPVYGILEWLHCTTRGRIDSEVEHAWCQVAPQSWEALSLALRLLDEGFEHLFDDPERKVDFVLDDIPVIGSVDDEDDQHRWIPSYRTLPDPTRPTQIEEAYALGIGEAVESAAVYSDLWPLPEEVRVSTALLGSRPGQWSIDMVFDHRPAVHSTGWVNLATGAGLPGTAALLFSAVDQILTRSAVGITAAQMPVTAVPGRSTHSAVHARPFLRLMPEPWLRH